MDREPVPRLSSKEELVLGLLGGGERYGLELVEASDGRLKRGTVYVTLNRMEAKGYVSSSREERRPGAIGLPRRMYAATGFGLRVLAAWQLVRERLADVGS